MNQIEDNVIEEYYLLNKKSIDNLIDFLKQSRKGYKSHNIEGGEWRICDSVLCELEPIVAKNKGITKIKKGW